MIATRSEWEPAEAQNRPVRLNWLSYPGESRV